jgi:pimeloyl-ACP methyl ester carboxylesterase
VRLHVEVHGDGPPLVLLHGFGGSARNWRPQIRALRDAYRVVVYDARGHARSDAPHEARAYLPDRLLEDLERVVRETSGDARPVVGGLSMGAGIALRFAVAAPERIRGLVLMAPPPGRKPAVSRSWARDFADAIERDGLEAAGDRYAWGEQAGLDPASGRLVRVGFLEHPPHALVHLLRNVLDAWPDAAEQAPALHALDVPTLLIVGERDRLSRREAEALAERIRGARLVVAPGAGHVVNLAARELVNEALEEFLVDLGSP